MKKILGIIITLLFFASVTVFTLPMMQDGANTDLTLTEKVTIMANAGDGGGGDEDEGDCNQCVVTDPGGDVLFSCEAAEVNECNTTYFGYILNCDNAIECDNDE